MSTALIGTAGAYFVAARLSAFWLICAPTFRNIPGVDLLVSDPKGASFISLQVKTSMWAMRERGRGEDKKPYEYQWAMNWTSARQNESNLFFAFVDLKDRNYQMFLSFRRTSSPNITKEAILRHGVGRDTMNG